MRAFTGKVRSAQGRRGSNRAAAVCAVALLLAGEGRALATAPAHPPPAGAPAAPTAPIELDGAPLEGRIEAARVPPEKDSSARLNGLVLLHLGDGVGAGGQLRIDGFGLRATLGYEPLLFVVDDDPGDQTLPDIEFSHSAHLSLDTLLMTKSEVGASLGYRYNTVLGHGVAVAFQSMFDLWRQRFAFSIPLMYFPKGTERVRDEYGLSSDYRINFPFGAGIQYGIGVAWLL